MWLFCPWRVLKTMSQWRHLKREGMRTFLPSDTVFYFKAFLLGLLTCTKPCARSADSFPWRASASPRSDTVRRTLDSSTETCECGCVRGLWNCTCWATAWSTRHTSEQSGEEQKQSWDETRRAIKKRRKANSKIKVKTGIIVSCQN